MSCCFTASLLFCGCCGEHKSLLFTIGVFKKVESMAWNFEIVGRKIMNIKPTQNIINQQITKASFFLERICNILSVAEEYTTGLLVPAQKPHKNEFNFKVSLNELPRRKKGFSCGEVTFHWRNNSKKEVLLNTGFL